MNVRLNKCLKIAKQCAKEGIKFHAVVFYFDIVTIVDLSYTINSQVLSGHHLLYNNQKI